MPLPQIAPEIYRRALPIEKAATTNLRHTTGEWHLIKQQVMRNG